MGAELINTKIVLAVISPGPHGLGAYSRCILPDDVQEYNSFIEDLSEIDNSTISLEHKVGLWADLILCYKMNLHDKRMYGDIFERFFSIPEDAKIGRFQQCWSLIEIFARAEIYFPNEQFEMIVEFTALNIRAAPTSAEGNFDVLLRSGGPSLIREVIFLYYIIRSCTSISYKYFVRDAANTLEKNHAARGEDWIMQIWMQRGQEV